jgi:hypothetical protein
VVLILFGLRSGRYPRVRSGVFVVFYVIVGRVGLSGFLRYRGLCFSLSILSAAGFRVRQVLLLPVVHYPSVLQSSCKARPTACALPHLDSVAQNRACGSARCVVLMTS